VLRSVSTLIKHTVMLTTINTDKVKNFGVFTGHHLTYILLRIQERNCTIVHITSSKMFCNNNIREKRCLSQGYMDDCTFFLYVLNDI
jgi:hypothetical protein